MNTILNDKTILPELLQSISKKIYNLSLRYLNDFDEANDATQDILIKIYNNYNKLREKEKFVSWSLTIATNHLINLKRVNKRFQHLSFDIMEQDCNIQFATNAEPSIFNSENDVLLAELKISCTQAMLMCLSKDERMIYILSSMFEQNSSQGAQIMNISREAYRKKLSRTKNKLRNFLENNCGLINKTATCKCRNRINYALETHRISRERLSFASPEHIGVSFEIKDFINTMDNLEHYSDVFKTNPDMELPDRIINMIKSLN